MKQSLNERMMFLHVLSFFFYVLCGIGFYIFLFHYFTVPEEQKEKATEEILVVRTVSNACKFFAQLCQFFIFKGFGQAGQLRKTKIITKSNYSIMKDTEENDEIDHMIREVSDYVLSGTESTVVTSINND